MPKTAVAICCDENILASSASVLRDAGYDVLRATTPETLLDVVHFLQPALILLDLDLPGSRAADVLHWIGGRQPRPRLLLISSSENLGLLREGFVVPAFELLIKPLGKDEMQAAVSRASLNTRNSSVPQVRQAKGHEFHRGSWSDKGGNCNDKGWS